MFIFKRTANIEKPGVALIALILRGVFIFGDGLIFLEEIILELLPVYDARLT